MKTNVYVDGFNLFYGWLKGSPYKWLDLRKLCETKFPEPRNTIHRIRYFTAQVAARPTDAQQPMRQLTYLRALRTVPNLWIHYGHYLESNVWMPRANRPPHRPEFVEVLKSEEKGSDVNIASFLLCDAFDGDFEAAIVITNDSDLETPIRMVRQKFGVRYSCGIPVARTIQSSRKIIRINRPAPALPSRKWLQNR